jgi:hypothetical protein
LVRGVWVEELETRKEPWPCNIMPARIFTEEPVVEATKVLASATQRTLLARDAVELSRSEPSETLVVPE